MELQIMAEILWFGMVQITMVLKLAVEYISTVFPPMEKLKLVK